MKFLSNLLAVAVVFIGLPILACGGCLVMFGTTAQQRTAPAVQADAESQRAVDEYMAETEAAYAEGGMDKHIRDFNEIIEASFIRTLVRDVEGSIRHTAVVHVEDTWNPKDASVRMEGAKFLQETWASLHSPNDPDMAKIRLMNLRGHVVGGSSGDKGTDVWVAQ